MTATADCREPAQKSRRAWLTTGVAALAACGATFLLTTNQSAEANATSFSSAQAATTIAVIDVDAAINGSQQGQALKASGQALTDEYNALIKALQDQIQQEQAAANQMNKESKAFRDKRREIIALNARGQGLQQAREAELAEFQRDQYLTAFRSMQAAVNQVAKDKGIAIVIRKNTVTIPDNIDQANPQQVGAILGGQSTLFVAPEADITTDVISAMNAAFGGGNAGGNQ